MLDGFSTYPSKLPTPRGAPDNPPSTHLRTLAWIRFLLDRMPDVEAWAQGKRSPPDGWRQRKMDADILRRTFRHKLSPRVSVRPSGRPVSLLDEVFGPIFSGRDGRSGLWFGDKVVRGLTRPSDERLAWLDDLVPGSLKAFYEPPAPLDPWFYDALDFESPWFGRLFLWRAMDPAYFHSEWDDLLQPTAEEGQSRRLMGHVREKMHARWDVTDTERVKFEAEMETALTHVAYPSEAMSSGFADALESLHAARAASRSGKYIKHPVVKQTRMYPFPQKMTGLTDAIAAYRLADLVGLEDRRIVSWWLRGALDAVAGRMKKEQLRWFYPMPNRTLPLEGALRKLGVWEPRATRMRRVPAKKKPKSATVVE
jgi:hypothetical protein